MTENEVIKEVRFNMSEIGLNDEAAKRVSEAKTLQYRHLKSRHRRNRILQKIKNLLYVLVAMVRACLTNRNIVIIAVKN